MAKSVVVTQPVYTTNTVIGSSMNPATVGGTVLFTAMVAPTTYKETPPSGTVTFVIDGVSQTPATLSQGIATLSTSALTTGNHTVVATYNATAPFTTSTSPSYTQAMNTSFTTAWHPTGPGTANVGSIANWKADVTDAAFWGAGVLVGDGATDNTPLLKAMLATITNSPLNKGGECFYFPAAGGGNYKFTSFFAAGQATVAQAVTQIPNIISAAGTGYAAGDTLTPVGGTSTTATVFAVGTVGGSGNVTSITLTTAGSYTVAPSSPCSTTTNNLGTGCTLAVSWVCIDSAFLSTVQFIGDLGADGFAASRLFTAAAGVSLWNAGNNTRRFQATNLILEATGTGSWATQFFACSDQVFDRCTIQGYNGLWNINPGGSFSGSIRDCRFVGTAGVSQIGLHIGGTTDMELHNCTFSGWVRGCSVQGTGVGIADTTFDLCTTGLAPGMTVTGGSGALAKSHFENLVFTNCDTALLLTNSSTNVYHNITITGSGAAPAGSSVHGINVTTFNSSTFDHVTISGSFSTAAINIPTGQSNVSFYSMSVANSSATVPNTVPAIWRGSSSITGVAASQLTVVVGATATAISLQTGTLIQEPNICDVFARHVTIGPESLITDATTIGMVGNNTAGASATANTTAIRSYINSHAGSVGKLYFPQGTYKFSDTLDFTPMKGIELLGDGCDNPAGSNGTILSLSGSVSSKTFLSFDYSTTGGCGQFHIRDMGVNTHLISGTGTASTAIYARNVAMSSIENSQLYGDRCLDLINGFGCVITGVNCASVTVSGLYFEDCYGCTIEGDDIVGVANVDAYRIGGGSNLAIFSTRGEVCRVGVRVGRYRNGLPAPTTNLSIASMSIEACDYGMIFEHCTNTSVGGIGVHCTNQGPSGQSRNAYWLRDITGSQFISCGNDATCDKRNPMDPPDGWAWYIMDPANTILLADCLGLNAAGANGFGTYSNVSSGTITQLACSFP